MNGSRLNGDVQLRSRRQFHQYLWMVVILVGLAGCSEVLEGAPESSVELTTVESAVGAGACSEDYCTMIGTRAGDDCYTSYPDQCGGCDGPACGAPNGGCYQSWCAQEGSIRGDDCRTLRPCEYCPQPSCALVIDHGEPDCIQPMCETIGMSLGDACRTYRPIECGGCTEPACADNFEGDSSWVASYSSPSNLATWNARSAETQECEPEPAQCVLDDEMCRTPGETINADITIDWDLGVSGSIESIAYAGDVDGDGMGDLLVGVRERSSTVRGAVYLFYGPVAEPLSLAQADARFSIDGYSHNGLGRAVAGVGDVDLDGFDDILIGDKDDSPDGRFQAGAAFLIYGGLNAECERLLAGELELSGVGTSIRGAWIIGDDQQGHFGDHVAGAGDINDDGYADFLLTQPNGGCGDSCRSEMDSVYVLFGGEGERELAGTIDVRGWGGSSIPGSRMVGANGCFAYGFPANAAGDINNDGVDDLVIGSPCDSYDAGAAFVVFGDSSLARHIHLSALETSGGGVRLAGMGGSAGQAVSGVGDVDGDGADDMVIGAPRENNTGRVYLIYGPLSHSIDLADVGSAVPGSQLYGTQHNGHLGAVLANTGDVDGDGLDDIYFAGDAYPETRSGFLLYGSTTHLPEEVEIPFDSSTEVGGAPIVPVASSPFSVRLGASGGDVNGDCLNDVLMAGLTETVDGVSQYAAWVVDSQRRCERSVECPAPATCTVSDDSCWEPGDITGADVTLEWLPNEELHIQAIAIIGDVDGNGFDDIAVELHTAVGPDFEAAVYLFYGPIQEPLNLTDADARLLPEYPSDRTQCAMGSVVAAGDVNRDGYDDMLVGDRCGEPSRRDEFTGAAYLLYGGLNEDCAPQIMGDIDLRTVGDSTPGARIIDGQPSRYLLGDEVAGVGDINGDTYDDIAISRQVARDIGGEIFLFYGGAGENLLTGTIDIRSGISGLPVQTTEIAASDDCIYSFVNFDRAGDVNRDGIGDLLIAPPCEQVAAYVLYGDATLPYRSFLISDIGESVPGVRIGPDNSTVNRVAPAGDVDGDGSEDILVSEYYHSRFGRVYLLYGPILENNIELDEVGVTIPGAVFQGIAMDDRFGWDISHAGDTDGDGYDDFLISPAEELWDDRDNQGLAFLIYGSSIRYPSGVLEIPTDFGTAVDGVVLVPDSSENYSNYTVAGGGDLNNDGLDDILLSGISEWVHGSVQDATWVIHSHARCPDQCEGQSNGTACDDGDLCTLEDQCVDEICQGTSNPCEPADACTTAECNSDTGLCVESNASDGTDCEDGDLCTTNHCASGMCVVASSTTCNEQDNNPCTIPRCDPATGACFDVEVAPDRTSCSDGDLCTTNHCSSGSCVVTGSTTCDEQDNNPCTVPQCNPATGACLDVEEAGPEYVCRDAADGACELDATCDGTLCPPNPPAPDETLCSDDDPCTTGDLCFDGVCEPDGVVSCDDDGNSCTDEMCNPTTGRCVTEAASPGTVCRFSIDDCELDATCEGETCPSNPPAPDGTNCEDENLCFDGDVCQAGTCVTGEAPVVCVEGDDNPCTAPVCDPTSGDCGEVLEPEGTEVGTCEPLGPERPEGGWFEECVPAEFCGLHGERQCDEVGPAFPFPIEFLCEDPFACLGCNGLDDNCDGIRDNVRLLVGPCGTAPCDVKAPYWVDWDCDLHDIPQCEPPPSPFCADICFNGVDDDCDGFVDETDQEPDAEGDGCVGNESSDFLRNLARPERGCFDAECNRDPGCIDDCGSSGDGDRDGLYNEVFGLHYEEVSTQHCPENGHAVCQSRDDGYFLTCERPGLENCGDSVSSLSIWLFNVGWITTFWGEPVCESEDWCNAYDDDGDGEVNEDELYEACSYGMFGGGIADGQMGCASFCNGSFTYECVPEWISCDTQVCEACPRRSDDPITRYECTCN